MTPKTYQLQVLQDLEQYIEVLNKSKSLSAAYFQFWEKKGIVLSGFGNDYLHPYINSVPGVPRVTLKVPTAGGKTFIACNAIKCIMDNLQSGSPNKVVAWFVPSDTILKQTLEKLQDVTHDYRKTIDADFAHRVVVVDKEAALMGQGINPVQLHDNLTIFVLSAQSFVETVRARNNRGEEQSKPRAFRENGNFIEHTHFYTHPELLIENTDPTALIQVIAQQNPLVIVDESHNFKADLRVELLNNLNPRFILELTATPRDNSNIISFVDAMQLKGENMVKLPVIVENRNSPKDVLVNAIKMRNSLERHAIEMEKQGGRYIRPIVLFQAQPKTDEDNITFDKIKKNLIDLGIPEGQIKIKNSWNDELKGVDLMSRECEVRYIITVNALKEGWDCPFAYILATLANKTSRVDVEQILGRILRLPHTVKHSNTLLNLSYVFTSSNDFRETVENIIVSLQKAGFSKKDFREISTTQQKEEPDNTPNNQLTFENELQPEDEKDELLDWTEEIKEVIKKQVQNGTPNDEVTAFQQQAMEKSDKYEEEMAEYKNNIEHNPLAAITPIEMYRKIKEEYLDVASKIHLPVFMTKTTPSLLSDNEWIPLEKTMLTVAFDLPTKDATIDFTISRPEGVSIDIAGPSDDYVPIRRSNQKMIDLIRAEYIDKTASVKKEVLCNAIAGMISLDNIPEPAIKAYVSKVIANKDEDEVTSLFEDIYHTKDEIVTKIRSLLEIHRQKVFKEWLNLGKIKLEYNYTFPATIEVMNKELVGIGKGLYTAEENVNDFEYDVVSAMADNPNVLFWHRNRKDKDFCINGFINHYPDFIVQMRSGYTILIETKGDYLDNDAAKNRIWLGNKWADLAGDNYKYFMVFESKEVEGAITFQQLVNYLNEL